jgi:PiT family inorganic phosphate transporter
MKTMMFIVLAPLIGLSLGYALMIAVFWICAAPPRTASTASSDACQLLSAAFYSLGHGTNDAQKTMGIITSLLFSAGLPQDVRRPWKVILMCHAVIALGTVFGGWRIVKTMGQRITKLRPVGRLLRRDLGRPDAPGHGPLGIPVSTTHTITGAIMGVGATQRFSRCAGAWPTGSSGLDPDDSRLRPGLDGRLPPRDPGRKLTSLRRAAPRS